MNRVRLWSILLPFIACFVDATSLLVGLLQWIIRMSNNSISFHNYATNTFLLQTNLGFFMLTD
ncbi:MAG TPA: hypothetical protein VF233_00135 [Nitrososphaeraceae archaeon]